MSERKYKIGDKVVIFGDREYKMDHVTGFQVTFNIMGPGHGGATSHSIGTKFIHPKEVSLTIGDAYEEDDTNYIVTGIGFTRYLPPLYPFGPEFPKFAINNLNAIRDIGSFSLEDQQTLQKGDVIKLPAPAFTYTPKSASAGGGGSYTHKSASAGGGGSYTPKSASAGGGGSYTPKSASTNRKVSKNFSEFEKLPVGEDITALGYCLADSGKKIRKILKKNMTYDSYDVELIDGEKNYGNTLGSIDKCSSNSSIFSRRNKQRRHNRRRSSRRR